MTKKMEKQTNIKKIIENSLLCAKYPFIYINTFRENSWYNKIFNYLFGDSDKRNLYCKAYKREKSYGIEYGLGIFKLKYVRNIFYAIWFWIVFGVFYLTRRIHFSPQITILDDFKSIAPGWYKSFGMQLMEDIKIQAKADKISHGLRINHIGTKDGCLDVVLSKTTKDMDRMLLLYSRYSKHTCINCGKQSTTLVDVSNFPMCDECFDNKFGDFADDYRYAKFDSNINEWVVVKKKNNKSNKNK